MTRSLTVGIISALVYFSCCSLNFGFAQGATSHWFHCSDVGLKFENHNPSLVPGFNLNTSQAAASLSDLNGNLLYYARPNLIMNRNHDTLQGSDGLIGGFSNTQGALFVPHPTKKGVTFFVHGNTMSNDTTLYYSIIRTSISLPEGFILPSEKNIPFDLLGNQAASKITAVHHSNGRDIWILTRVFRTDSIAAFLVSESDVSGSAVFSYAPGPDTTLAFYGQMKASPNGKLLCEANNVIPDGSNITHSFHQFNHTTGEVINSVSHYDTLSAPYGAEFSANSKYAFFTRFTYTDSNLNRFDLSIFDSASIVNSVIELGDTGRLTRSLQIGIDKKIYGIDNVFMAGRFDVIEDASLSNSVFVPDVFTNVPVANGLPDFIQSFFRSAYFDYSKACFGDSTEFISQTVGEDSLKWNFGEPSSGALNVSTEKNPKHLYAQAGEYNVTLIVYADSSIDTFSRLIQIKLPLTGIQQLGDTVCNPTPFSLNPNPNQPWSNHLWMDSIWQDSFLIADTGKYWVDIWNDCDTIRDTIFVSNDPGIDFNFIDTSVCSTFSFSYPVPDSANTWQWGDGDTTSTVKSFQQDSGSITVWLEASNSCGTVSDTATVTFIPTPNTDWFTDSILCGLEAPILEAPTSNWAQFVLQNPAMDTLNPWLINDAGNYLLTAFNECDTVQKTAYLSPRQLISVSLPALVALCPGEEVVLDASWPNATHVWSVNDVVDTSLIDSVITRFYPDETEVVEVEITSPPCVKRLQTIVSPLVADSCAPCAFEVPNVFSPNGDGINDVLQISNACSYQEFTFFIYNRWGQLVHTSNQSIPNWDGSIQGAPAAEGAYFIVVEYTDENGELASVRNAVSLLR